MTRREQLLKLCETDDFDVTNLAYLLIEENEKLRGALSKANSSLKNVEGLSRRFRELNGFHPYEIPSSPLDELLKGAK